ncbi:MAG: dimethylargininase [Deltaproteobacteria bacterium]|nr:dimethylargininase [Deltaproteobacteria bacterium]MBK8240885.1 dimethylargininase [Deltaproteobacteria bacterium]MBK8714113.1 dimethylargininase [Deltaproteobacteria bacterium]MBP7285634.1 hypothetical protein [Nannocystaceae bacterium]
MPLTTPTHAFVRAPSTAYARCLREQPCAIDVGVATQQHDGYVAALRDAGIDVQWLPPLVDAPDATFVEDTAVVVDGAALVTHPGALARREETPSVAAVLASSMAITHMHGPATLDGGDVMRCGDTLVVGHSQRTNEGGIAALTEFAARFGLRTHVVQLAAGLHLKSACTMLDAATLLYWPGAFTIDALAPLRLDCIAVSEPAGANVLPFADRVLMSDAAPRTAELVAKRGGAPRLLALSQIHAGDGALTCLSLRVPPAGAWVA